MRAKATTEDHIGQFKLYIELPLVDSAGNKDTIAYYRRSSESGISRNVNGRSKGLNLNSEIEILNVYC